MCVGDIYTHADIYRYIYKIHIYVFDGVYISSAFSKISNKHNKQMRKELLDSVNIGRQDAIMAVIWQRHREQKAGYL